MNSIAQLPDVTTLPIASAGAVVAQAWADGWRMREAMSVSDWAEKHRVLASVSSAEPGRFRIDRTPHVREILDSLSIGSPVRKVVVMSGTQIAKTESGLNWLGYIVMQDPAPTMVVQPTSGVAKKYSQQRVTPMIKVMPELQELFMEARSRDGGNTTFLKEFSGGLLLLAGANSGSDLRSTPVKYLHLDEVDAYPLDIDGEGSPIDLAERRTSTYSRRKILITSTPTESDASAIQREYLNSDQRRRWVPCPYCGEFQVLVDTQITAGGDYLCEHCGDLISEHQKIDLLANGEWRADNPGHAHRGYQISALYAMPGLGYSWLEIAEMRAEAQSDPVKKKTYYNTILGLPYESKSNRLEAADLMQRAGDFEMRSIPNDVYMLTAGIDVQDDRLALLIVGWGRGERAFVIDWIELPCDPASAEAWAMLDDYLQKTLKNEFGYDMPISAFAVDTGGHHTHTVYQYVRERQARLALAIKGASTKGRPIIASRPRAQDVNTKGGTLKSGVDLWMIGADTAKGTLYARMRGDEDTDANARLINFARDLPTDFYEQLASEIYDPDRKLWVLRNGRRNEALDCFVYAMAAACHPLVRVHMLKQADWDRIESIVHPVQADLFTAPQPVTPSEDVDEEKDDTNSPTPSRKRRSSRNRNSSFIHDY